SGAIRRSPSNFAGQRRCPPTAAYRRQRLPASIETAFPPLSVLLRSPLLAALNRKRVRPLFRGTLLTGRSRLAQIFLRLRLALERRNLVGIDANHEIRDVIVDLGEPVAGARRNHDHVASLDVVRHAVLDVRSVVPGSVVLDDGSLRGRT